MKNGSTLLSRQKKSIILLAALAAVLAIVYLLFVVFSREEKHTVLKVDSDGDEVFAVISDTGDKDRGINITYINNVLSGNAENRYNVKKGETDDVLCTFEANDVKITYFPMIFPEIQLDSLDFVTLSNDNGSFKVYIDPESGNPVIEQAKNNLYNSSLLSTLILQARYMLASSKLTENVGKLSDYGLDLSQNPTCITVCDKSGNINTVYMGDMAPNGGYYMKNADKDIIYVSDYSVSVFENGLPSFLSPIVTRSIDSDYAMYINRLTYVKNGKELFTCEIIPDEERTGTLKNQLHRIVSPESKKQDILSTVTLYEMFSSLSSLSGSSVVEYNVSGKENYAEVMLSYGFDDPTAVIEYSFGENNYYVTFGNSYTDEESGELYYYAYGPYMDTIVVVPSSNVPFLDYEYIDFVHNKMFQHNIDDVEKVVVGTNSGSRSFKLEGTGKELSVVEQNSKKAIDTASFRQFYFAILSIGVDGYSELNASVNTEELEHTLSLEILLKSGETLKYSFYSESTLRCYAVINGVGEFYTKREYVDKISKFADMLMSGEEIKSQT